jgi:hypothetical protein
VLVKQNRKGNRVTKNGVRTHEEISKKVRRKNSFEQVLKVQDIGTEIRQ